MTGFYSYLESVMPLKRILISLAVGLLALLIVLYAGLKSDFVSAATVVDRTFSAFSFTTLACFIFLMCCEEYAIFKTKRSLENFIDEAPLQETQENFNRAEYLHEYEKVSPDNSFRPMNFA